MLCVCGWGGRHVREVQGEGTNVYLWLFHTLFGRNQHNIVKQLSSTLKKKKQKERERKCSCNVAIDNRQCDFSAFKLFIFVFQIFCYFGTVNIISQ